MGTRPTDPRTAAVVAWMKEHGDRLRELLEEEGEDAEDCSPAGEAAVRGQLRFQTEALAATAPARLRGAIERFADELPERFEGEADMLEEELQRASEAAGFEARMQFGDAVGEDPSFVAVVGRGVLISAWSKFYLRLLDEALGEDGRLAGAAGDWMDGREDELALMIFSVDRRAKQAEIARGGEEAVSDADRVNLIGQAALLQARMRFLVEAVSAGMAACAPSR
jgi:hypothetical protein